MKKSTKIITATAATLGTVSMTVSAANADSVQNNNQKATINSSKVSKSDSQVTQSDVNNAKQDVANHHL